MRTKPITLLPEIFAILAAGGIMTLFIAVKEDYEPMICPYLITYNDPSAISSLMAAGAVLLAAGAAGLAVTIVIKVKAGRNTFPHLAECSSLRRTIPDIRPRTSKKSPGTPKKKTADKSNNFIQL